MNKPKSVKKPKDETGHKWEIVTMSDGRKEKRCSKCLYAYAFGRDMGCPAMKEEADMDKLADAALARIRSEAAKAGAVWALRKLGAIRNGEDSASRMMERIESGALPVEVE